ncbi:MAG: HigA family addiction module antidote protein [Proteobacteria bacterium]|nr:HigA family addiction module antidote protein [Pseudomonadota bacterium]MCH9711916.1 HigA family addiction module antidote protein [Pseudomonadota bacterium]MCH9750264.1 HigA family addiction module antidote protein [Pseudomonadota bacterium]
MMKNNFYPGEFLQELLDDYNITAYRLSKDIYVQQSRIGEILKGSRTITSDTAIRLGKYFNNSPQYWLNLQNSHDLANCNVENYRSINPI